MQLAALQLHEVGVIMSPTGVCHLGVAWRLKVRCHRFGKQSAVAFQAGLSGQLACKPGIA